MARKLKITAHQLDLFNAPSSNGAPIGSEVKLPTACACGAPHATICPGKPPHCAEMRCAKCGKHRGWVSRNTFDFISKTIELFGRPTEPITVRGAKQ
jgi:hypothetical protein